MSYFSRGGILHDISFVYKVGFGMSMRKTKLDSRQSFKNPIQREVVLIL